MEYDENLDPMVSPTIAGFNPSGLGVVDQIKQQTDELIHLLNKMVPQNRERSIAITNYEQAAMWAVKANFTKG